MTEAAVAGTTQQLHDLARALHNEHCHTRCGIPSNAQIAEAARLLEDEHTNDHGESCAHCRHGFKSETCLACDEPWPCKVATALGVGAVQSRIGAL